jgi:hypothetical protein
MQLGRAAHARSVMNGAGPFASGVTERPNAATTERLKTGHVR